VSTPEQQSPSLAERVARALATENPFHRWEALDEHGRYALTKEAEHFLAAVDRAGLAVVEAPEPDEVHGGEPK
jgi:hypothetical protein